MREHDCARACHASAFTRAARLYAKCYAQRLTLMIFAARYGGAMPRYAMFDVSRASLRQDASSKSVFFFMRYSTQVAAATVY